MNIFASSRGSVKFRCDIVCAKTGRTVKRGKEQSNLLFDFGLNNLSTMLWTGLFDRFVLGTGTTPVRRDSGVITFTRSGTTVTASANFFEAGDSGRLLKWDTGEECYLTYVDGTTATSNVSGTVAAAEGTVYYVNRNSLAVEVKRTGTVTADTGDHGWSWNGTTGILSTWVTRIFSAETGTVTYREIGWSNSVSAGANINGAALIAGGGDVLVADQQYKVRLQLDRVITPRISRALAASDVVDLWTGTAAEIVESLHYSVWNTAGAVGNAQTGNTLEPSTSVNLELSTTALALRSIDGGSSSGYNGPPGFGGTKAVAFSAYAAGSFTRSGLATWQSTEANSTALRSVFTSAGGPCGLRVHFDSAQTKSSSQKLTIGLRKSWGRVLVN